VKTKNENSRKLFSVFPVEAFENWKQSKNKNCFLKPNARKCPFVLIWLEYVSVFFSFNFLILFYFNTPPWHIWHVPMLLQKQNHLLKIAGWEINLLSTMQVSCNKQTCWGCTLA